MEILILITDTTSINAISATPPAKMRSASKTAFNKRVISPSSNFQLASMSNIVMKNSWMSDSDSSCGPPEAPFSDSDTNEPGNVESNTNEPGNEVSELKKHFDLRFVKEGYDVEGLMREMAEGSEDQEAFFVVDLAMVLNKLKVWKELMPRVKPFYAVKCNNDAAICRLLASAGCGFDCASQAEIEQIMAMGVTSDRIIYANPCKQASMLRFARANEVRLMTADNVEELRKIQKLFPEARIIIRIAVDDSKSVCRFNSKFGAPPREWDALLSTARELSLDIEGFSFHVGSGCGDLQPFADAVASARDAFELARSYGFSPSLLDVGGGYPGHDGGNLRFEDVARTVSGALEKHFPAGCGVEVIAEPGRYMCSASHSYAVAVIAKRALSASQLADAGEIESFGARPGKEADAQAENQFSGGHGHGEGADAPAAARQAEVALYINDGVYGSFNCVVFDHAVVTARPLVRAVANNSKGGVVGTKLFGPTCDSIDVVAGCAELPEMAVGDWLCFRDMGAYTRCAASRFNGQGAHSVHYLWAA